MLGPVPHMQTILADSLRRGISGLGNRALQKSQFGLESAMAEHTMGRQSAADERQAGLDALALPGQQVASQMAQGQMEEYNKMFHISMMAPSLSAVGHILGMDEDDPKRAPYHQFVKMWGEDAKLDTTEGSPTRGGVIVNGKALSVGDITRNSEPIEAFIKANTGLNHFIEAKEEQLGIDYTSGGIDDNEYQKRKAFIDNLKTDIPTQMQIAQEHIDFISRFVKTGNPLFQGNLADGLKRWQAKYNKLGGQLEKQQAEAGKREWEKELAELKRDPKEGGHIGPYKKDGSEVYEVYKNGKWEKHSTNIADWEAAKGDKGDKKSYEESRDKLVDDTISHYKFIMRGLLNDMGYIKPGPEDDPQKYEREYSLLVKRMEEDKKLISDGTMPSWYTREKTPITDDIAQAIAEEVMKGVDQATLTNEERKKLREKARKMAGDFGFEVE